MAQARTVTDVKKWDRPTKCDGSVARFWFQCWNLIKLTVSNNLRLNLFRCLISPDCYLVNVDLVMAYRIPCARLEISTTCSYCFQANAKASSFPLLYNNNQLKNHIIISPRIKKGLIVNVNMGSSSTNRSEVFFVFFTLCGLLMLHCDYAFAAKKIKCTSVHVVNRGEQFSRLARQYGLTERELLDLNPFITDPHQILAGDRLCMATSARSEATTSTTTTTTTTSTTPRKANQIRQGTGSKKPRGWQAEEERDINSEY